MWEIKKLGDIATYVNGFAFKPEQWVDEGEAAREPVSSKLIMTPTKPSTAQYSYVWNGWDRDYTEINSPMDFYPTFESILRSYLVRFYNDSILLHEA
mgnify:CR=1 FL=1